MCVFPFLSSLFIVATSASVASEVPVPGVALVHSRLRGSARKSTQPWSGKDVEPALPPGTAAAEQLMANKRYSDDDESCSAEGITPGVCALSFLTRPTVLTVAGKRNASEKHEPVSEHDQARDKLENALIAEMESAIAGNHKGFGAAKIQKLKQELKPIFETLPHKQPSANGLERGLDYVAARYLLHQHFVRQHSWYVRGLNPAGDGRLPPNPKESLRSRVAGHLLKVMQDKAGEESFGLHMLANFIATLEHLFQGDQHELLKRVWSAYGLQLGDLVDAPTLRVVLEMYLAQNVLNSRDRGDKYMLSREAALKDVAEMRENYDGWPKVVHRLEALGTGPGQNFSLKDASLEADTLLQFFSAVSGSMCHTMEQKISKFNGGDQGLVKLSDLRELHADTGAALVDESDEYLRKIGSLVESSGHPHIAVPNYMLGPSNCDMSTSFYDLCCPNACESHKEHLERALVSAKVNRSNVIAEIVQQRRGSALPVDMMKLLDDIANAYKGTIPTHGRAFADWLHQAFPRECPRTRAQDFAGAAGDLLPDANAEFQAHTSIHGWNDPERENLNI